MKTKNILAILSLICLPLASVAAIGTYYVSPSGNDSNDGTSWEQAFATPDKGFDTINESDKRGSDLWIDSGEYALTKTIRVNGGGKESTRSFVRGRTGNPDDVILYADGTFDCLRIGKYIQISGITFSNGVNSASCVAGGIRFAGAKPVNEGEHPGIISNCVVTCCQNILGSGTNGAAVVMYSNDLMIDSVIRDNTASEWCGAGVLMVDYDRDERVTGPTMKRCRVERNSAASNGGGVYVSNYGGTTPKDFSSTDVQIIDCEIVGNSAVNAAGLLCVTNMTVNMTGCIISDNTATSNSGGLRLENGCNLSMRDCIVEGNEAGSGAGADVIGVTNTVVTVLSCSNTVFRNNSARATGGGARVYNYAQIVSEDSLFSENSAVNTGGGIYFNAQGKGWFDRCRFEDNQVTSTEASNDRGGGGIFLGAQTATVRGYCSVSNCVFASNTSGSRAGGMGGTWNKCYFGGAIVNCVFTNNSSRVQGGGLVIRDNSPSTLNPDPPIIRNCLFAFNETTDATGDTSGGGVMFATYSDVTLENCTIVSNNISNTAGYKSGGIHHRFTGKLKNCIVAFNTVCGEREDANYWNNVDTLTAANFINCCSDLANNKFSSENGCVIGDPKFTDPANGDWTIKGSSPCRNAGVNSDWMDSAFDLLGNPRIIGGTVDIGCFEFKPIPGMAVFVR